MQWDVDLNEPFSYSTIGFLILCLALVVTMILVILVFVKYVHNTKVGNFVKNIDVMEVKSNYIIKINTLVDKVNNKSISQRKAYNELSVIIREFVFNVTNIDVLKYTLYDIKKLNNEELTELVKEYYVPEFSKEGNGDLMSSIDKTRKVIQEWK